MQTRRRCETAIVLRVCKTHNDFSISLSLSSAQIVLHEKRYFCVRWWLLTPSNPKMSWSMCYAHQSKYTNIHYTSQMSRKSIAQYSNNRNVFFVITFNWAIQHDLRTSNCIWFFFYLFRPINFRLFAFCRWWTNYVIQFYPLHIAHTLKLGNHYSILITK